MTKRTPGMYHFYQTMIQQAIEDKDWELYGSLIDDAPKDVKKALIRNEIIEESVESSRSSHVEYELEEKIRNDTLEQHLRLAISVLNEQGYLADRAWPDSYAFEELLFAAKEIENAENELQLDNE